MDSSVVRLSGVLCFLAMTPAVAWAVPPDKPDDRAVCHPIEIFTREDCRQCEAAERFLEELSRKRPDARVKRHDVVTDGQALKRLHELCRKHRIEKVGVPGVLVGNQLFVGYRDDATTGVRIEELLTIEVFTRAGCPHCAQAKLFLADLLSRYPGLHIVVTDVVADMAARQRMEELVRRHRIPLPSLPMFSAYGRVIVGYHSAESTGRELEQLIINATARCAGLDGDRDAAEPQRPSAPAAPAPREMGFVSSLWGPWCAAIQSTSASFMAAPEEPVEVVPEEVPLPDEAAEISQPQESDEVAEAPAEEIEVPLFGTLRVADLGLPAFTFLLGLVDGFNPCAMWVLIFLLSVLVNLKDRRRIIAIAGTFVLISGLAYFAFMAAWLNVFALIGFARWAQIGLGLVATFIGLVNVKDFFAFKRGFSLSIPESAKPGIYARVRNIVSAKYLTAAVIGAVVLAVLVNTVELLCTAGLPALYTQILSFRQFPWWKNYAYLALYNVAYMFDDTIMLTVAVVTLSHRKLQEREGRWLKLVSGLVILGLGLLLLFKPDWLD